MLLENKLMKLVFVAYIACLIAVAYHQTRIKKSTIPLPDIATHSLVIILIGKLIWSTQTSQIDLIFGIIICFASTFMVGMIVGKSIGIPNNNKNNSAQNRQSNTTFNGMINDEYDDRMNMTNSNIDVRDSSEFISSNDLLSSQFTGGFEMDDEGDNDNDNDNSSDLLIESPDAVNTSSSASNQNDITNSATVAIPTNITTNVITTHYNGQLLEDIHYLSKRTLISITGLIESSLFSSQYVPTSWKSVKSEHPFFDSWTSHHFSTDGVLFQATMRVNATPERVLQYLIDEGVETGLECIAFKNELIQTIAPTNKNSNNNNFNNNNNNNNNNDTNTSTTSSIRKFYVKSASTRTVKRLFTVLTSLQHCNNNTSSTDNGNNNTNGNSGSNYDDMIILSTRSVDLPIPNSSNNSNNNGNNNNDSSMNDNDGNDDNHNHNHNNTDLSNNLENEEYIGDNIIGTAYIKGRVYGSGYILRPVIAKNNTNNSNTNTTNRTYASALSNDSNNASNSINGISANIKCDVTFAIHLDMCGLNIVNESQSTTSISSAVTDTSASTTKTITTANTLPNNNLGNSAIVSVKTTAPIINTTSGRVNARKSQIMLKSVQQLFSNMYSTFYVPEIGVDNGDNNNKSRSNSGSGSSNDGIFNMDNVDSAIAQPSTATATIDCDNSTTNDSVNSSDNQNKPPIKPLRRSGKGDTIVASSSLNNTNNTSTTTIASSPAYSMSTAMTGSVKDLTLLRSKNVTNQIRQLYKEQLHHITKNNIQISGNNNSKLIAAAAVAATQSNNNHNNNKRQLATKRGSTASNNLINNNNSCNPTVNSADNNKNATNNSNNNGRVLSDKSTTSGSSSSSRQHIESVPELETIFYRDGVLILEHTDTDRVFGTVSATCHIDTPPEIVQAALICLRSAVDGLLTCKNTLCELDNNMTCVQYQTYKTPYPIGSRDFLLVHSQESFYHYPTTAEARQLLFSGNNSGNNNNNNNSGSSGNYTKSRSNSNATTASITTNNTNNNNTNNRNNNNSNNNDINNSNSCSSNNSTTTPDINREGFIMSWASIDDICDDVDKVQESLERIANRSNINMMEYTRTNLRTGGYVCVPCVSYNNNTANNNSSSNSSSSGNAGCDVSLFFDADMWNNIPTWLAHVLAQVVVYEMMRELRIATFNLYSPPPSIKNEIFINNSSSINNNIYDNNCGYHSYTSSSSSSRQHSQIDQILQQVERREKRMKMEITQNEVEWNKMIAKLHQQTLQQQYNYSNHQQQQHLLHYHVNNNNSNQQQSNRQIMTQQQQQQQQARNALVNSAGSNNSNNFKTIKLSTTSATSPNKNHNQNNNINNTDTNSTTSTLSTIEQRQQQQHQEASPTSVTSTSSSSNKRRPSQHSQTQLQQQSQQQSQQSPLVKLNRSRSSSQSANTTLATVAAYTTANASDTAAPAVSSTTTAPSPLSSSLSTTITASTTTNDVPAPADVSDFARDSFKRMFQYLGIDKVEASRRTLGLQWEMKVQKDGIDVESSMVIGSDWQAIKATTYMNANKHSIRALLLDDKRMVEYDDMFDFYKFLVSMDERTRVRRLAFKGIWPTSPRDFIVGTTWTELKNGTILIVSRSVPNVMGEQSGYVRGCVQVSGFLIQPSETLSNDNYAKQRFPQGCKVTLCAHTELGGSLPSSIVNMLSTSAPLKMLDSIRNLVKPTATTAAAVKNKK